MRRALSFLTDIPARSTTPTSQAPPAIRAPRPAGCCGLEIRSCNRIVGRSVTLQHFVGLADIPGVTFISLQKGDAAVEACRPPRGLVIHDWTHELYDFADTAALIDGLDLVIRRRYRDRSPSGSARQAGLAAQSVRYVLALTSRSIGLALVSDHEDIPPAVAGRLAQRLRRASTVYWGHASNRRSRAEIARVSFCGARLASRAFIRRIGMPAACSRPLAT
jgi:hypothetical protein